MLFCLKIITKFHKITLTMMLKRVSETKRSKFFVIKSFILLYNEVSNSFSTHFLLILQKLCKQWLFNDCNEVPKFQITVGSLKTSFYFNCMSLHILSILNLLYFWYQGFINPFSESWNDIVCCCCE